MSEPDALSKTIESLTATEFHLQDQRSKIEEAIEQARVFSTFLAGVASAIFAGGVVAPLIGWLLEQTRTDSWIILWSGLLCTCSAALLYVWAENEVEAAYALKRS